MPLAFACAATFALSLLLTPIVQAGASWAGLVARPQRDRWHTRPTALLGGIAIQLAFLGGYLVFQPALEQTFPLVAIATFVFAVGLLDDLMPMTPAAKLAAQLLAAAATVALGFRLPWTPSPFANDLVTVVWLVGITNAMNLLDNMDGLAAGVGAIACGFLAITFVVNGQHEVALVPALLAGALLGFLAFNRPPASIFMGDCGALFVGALLGQTALLSDYGRSRNLTAVLLTPVLILMIPILDTTLVTVTRTLAGRPMSVGGRDHTSHRLVALGLSERGAVVTLCLLSVASGSLALTVRWLTADVLQILLPAYAALVLLFAFHLSDVEIGGDRHAATPAPTAYVSTARRAVEVLLDVPLIGLAWYGAFLLRDGWHPPVDQLQILTLSLPVVLGCELLALALGGVYRDRRPPAGNGELQRIARAALGGGFASAVAVTALSGLRGPSPATLVLNAFLLLLLATASRLGMRLARDVVVRPALARPVLIGGGGTRRAFLFRGESIAPDDSGEPRRPDVRPG